MASGLLFVISGPAGAGKSKIVKKLIEKHPDIGVSVSCTTRKKRDNEVEGVDYYFVSNEEFDEKIASGALYEWAFVHADRYGTLKSVVADKLCQGHDLILEIDVQGCLQAMKQNPDQVTSIFVCPPSRENLEKRLRDRKSETEESFRLRLHTAIGEMKQGYHYQYVIIHQDWSEVPNALEIAAEEVYAIVQAKRLETKRHTDFLDRLSAALDK